MSRNASLQVRTLTYVVFGLMIAILAVTAVGAWWLLGDRPPRTQLEADYKIARSEVRANPKNPLAREKLGAVYVRMGRYESARDAYAAAVKMSPKDARLRYNYAVALGLMGEGAKAIEQAEECTKLYKAAAPAYYLIGSIHFEEKRYDKAVGPLEKAVEHETSDCDARYLLGRTYLELDKDDKALEQFEKVKSMVPEYEGVDEMIEKAKGAE